MILFPPLYMAHRRAWQWGAGTKNGAAKKPKNVAGTHQYVYMCADT